MKKSISKLILFYFSIYILACGQPGELALYGELPKATPASQIETKTVLKMELPPIPQNLAPPPPVIKFSNPENIATIAYEDEYPRPGDADYKDFVLNLSVQEKVNSRGEIYQIIIDFVPRALGASFDHSLNFVFNGKIDRPTDKRAARVTAPLFEGDAEITLSHMDQAGKVIDVQNNLQKTANVVIFPSTHNVFGGANFVNVTIAKNKCIARKPSMTARLEINLKEPALNILGDRREIDMSKYRVVLHVKNTNKDIDIVDVNPSLTDEQGLPFGLFVPTDWKWPAAGKDLRNIYPDFKKYSAYLLAHQLNPSLKADDNIKNWFEIINPKFQKNLSHCD